MSRFQFGVLRGVLIGLYGTVAACSSPVRCWDLGACLNPEDSDASAAVSAVGDAAISTSSTSSLEATEGGLPPSSSAASSAVASGRDASAGSASDASPGAFDSAAVQCADDTQCSAVCVAGACEACDPADHRGCETASTKSRCLAALDGNRCVECLQQDTPPSSGQPCGLNQRGLLLLDCVNDTWQPSGCEDPDVCADEDTDVGNTPCGPNGIGRYLRECISGAWSDTATCIDDDVCVNGDRRASDVECGFSGYLDSFCLDGKWLVESACTECLRPFSVPDENLAYFLAQNSIDQDPLYPRSVKYYTELNLAFSSIHDLTGLQCFTSLRRLDLAKNQVSDLTPLAGLTALETLNLTNNKLRDLTPLAGLTNLTQLTITGAEVSSLDGLQTLQALTHLDAGYNTITDVTPLLPLSSLQQVTLNGNLLDCDAPAFVQLETQVPTLYSDCP